MTRGAGGLWFLYDYIHNVYQTVGFVLGVPEAELER
jgi:hypothetical protein